MRYILIRRLELVIDKPYTVIDEFDSLADLSNLVEMLVLPRHGTNYLIDTVSRKATNIDLMENDFYRIFSKEDRLEFINEAIK